MYRNRWMLVMMAMLCMLHSRAAFAFAEEWIPAEMLELMEEWEPVEVTGDAIPWELFAETEEIMRCHEDAEGYDYCVITPGYSEEITQLDGTDVTLMGFMFPFEPKEDQTHFLLGPYPLSCPFHYHVGPSVVVEVNAAEVIDFSYEPVTLTGRLEVRFDQEAGSFYYLQDARAE